MIKDILNHLKIKQCKPGLEYLQELIVAYCTTVPWESISRIAKKATCSKPEECLRLEDEFWTQSINYGTGGTCYESNWAFFKLLISLGFDGYLTINKIIDKSSVHSAIVIIISKNKYIVDIGYPLYAAFPIVENGVGYASYQGVQYCSTYISSNEYLIENFPHPKPYLYHLSDIPVSTTDYLNIGINDYADTGLFLDRIIIRKIINNTPTRFDSEDLPSNIHQLHNGAKTKTNLEEETLLKSLSDFFAVNINILEQAFCIVNKTAQNEKTKLSFCPPGNK